jgi:Alternative complex III, ActD subunit
MSAHSTRPPIYGVMAEFTHAEELIEAARRAHEAGYRKMDAYTPFPVEGLSEAMHTRPSRLPFIVLMGGIVGGLTGYLMQYYASVVAYPLNVGGRPLHSWPAFIPVTFELTILIAALSAVLGMLALNGLPRPYHPVFNVDAFIHASRDRFYLVIEARDPKFDREETAEFLESLPAHEVFEVGH